MFNLLLGIFLFLSPIFFLPHPIGNLNALQFYQFGVIGNLGYDNLEYLFFGMGVLILFVSSVIGMPQRRFNGWSGFYLFLIFCISLYFSPIGIKLFYFVFLSFLLYYSVVVYVKNYKCLYVPIFFVVVLNTIFAVLQHFNIDPIYTPIGRCDGLMRMSTHMGAYQAITLPIVFELNPWLAIIPLISIVLSKSMTAIVVSFCWIAWKTRCFRSMPIMMSVLSGGIGLIIYQWHHIIYKLGIRLDVWIPALQQIMTRPFLGHGIKPLIYNWPGGRFDNPCNIYLELLYCVGVFALIPLYFMICDVIESKEKTLSACILIALVIGMEKSIMDFPTIGATVIVLMGLLTANKQEVSYST